MNVITNNNLKCTIALAALQHVMDPEIGLNIVDLGLIYQLDFEDDTKVLHCSMTLTTQYCPMGESIANAAREALTGSFPEYECGIELTFDPPWSYERISGEGREHLNRR